MLDKLLATNTVTVYPYQGPGATRPSYGAPVQVQGLYDGGDKLVRGPQSDQIVANAVFYTALANRDLFTTDSKVTMTGQPDCRVVGLDVYATNGVLPDHIAVHLV